MSCNFGCGLFWDPVTKKLTFCGDNARGLECDPAANNGEGCWFVKVDGSSITYNASGQLQASVPDACTLGVPYFNFASGQDDTGYHTGENPAPGDTVKSFCVPITNNDPCGRSGIVRSTIDWSGFSFNNPLGGNVDVKYEYSFDGGATWIEDTDRQFESDDPMTGTSASRTHHTSVAPGDTLTVCARYTMGSTHSSANVVYQFYNLAIHLMLIAGGA
jgi:hypothetical protein